MRKTIHETLVPFAIYAVTLIGFGYSVVMLS